MSPVVEVESVLGFRRFTLRGLEKAKLEWTLVSTAYNLKRLHRMVGTVRKASAAGWRKVEWAGFDESDGVSSKSGSRILNVSRPTSKKPENLTIALAGTLQNDILSPTAC